MTRPNPAAGVPAPPELIHQRADAMAIFLVPDVCKTPMGPNLVPVPYPAVGLASTGMAFSTRTKANGLPFMHKGSKFSVTMGDEPGVGGGVKSGTVKGLVEPVASSMVVKVEGQPVIRHGDQCTLNSGNCLGQFLHIKNPVPFMPPSAAEAGGGSGAGAGGGGGGQSWSFGAEEAAGVWERGASTGVAGGAPAVPSGPGFSVADGLGGVRCTKG